MKFSKTCAFDYLNNQGIRNQFHEIHKDLFRKKLLKGNGISFPQHTIFRLIEAGFGPQYEKSRDITTWPPAMLEVFYSEQKKILTDISGVKVYLIRKTVQEICAKINIREERKFDYLQKMNDGNRILVLDEGRFFKYYKEGSRIVVSFFEKDSVSFLSTMFNFELEQEYSTEKDTDRMVLAEKLFLQLIMFMEYAPFEEVFLKPSQKNGTRSEGKVLNDSPQNLIIVDSSWNKVIVRTEGFTVGADTGGFLALRACGVGRYDRRFVWIAPFEKEGYVRGLNKNKKLEHDKV